MSLGQQLAPVVPDLRQYARLIMGDWEAGDQVVQRTLDRIVADPTIFPRDVSARVGLHRLFEQSFTDRDLAFAEQAFAAPISSKEILSAFGDMSLLGRKATLLISVEGFSAADTAYILGITSDQVNENLDQFFKSSSPTDNTKILIVEPEQSIAAYIKILSEDLGHAVIGSASTVEEALSLAKTHLPDIVISETRLRSGSIFELLGGLIPIADPDVMIVTGDPDDLGYGRTHPSVSALLTKPFSEQAFRATLTRVIAGGVDLKHSIPKIETHTPLRDQEILSAAPVPFAPTAKVSGTVVEFVGRPPLTSTSLDRLNVLRIDHAEDAERVATLGHNLGASFSSRMNKIAFLLSQPLSEESMLRVANQAQSLSEFTKSIDEEMLPVVAGDIKSVIFSLQQFSKQFPAWREFLAATENPSLDAPDTRHEIANLAQTLQNTPGLLSNEVSDALVEASSDLLPDDNRSRGYLAGLVHNIYSAMGRYVMKRGAGIADNFHKKLDEEVGNALASGVTTALIVASTPLLALASAVPSEWAWVGPVIALLRASNK